MQMSTRMALQLFAMKWLTWSLLRYEGVDR